MVSSGRDWALIARIDETMQATGYSTNASRSPAEIARRLKEKLELAETRLDGAGPAAAARVSLARTAAVGSLRRPGRLCRCRRPETRARPCRASTNGSPPLPISASIWTRINYRAAFGRPLDYYTGLVYEIGIADQPAVLAGGGRFDRSADPARRRKPHSGRRLLALARPYRKREGRTMTITIGLPSKGRMKDDCQADV